MMSTAKFLLTILAAIDFIILQCDSQETIPRNPLTKMSLEDRIKYYGYPVELHTITTQDGYILSLYRIPGPSNTRKTIHDKPENTSNEPKKSAVLLLHGMGGSPGNYFIMGNNSLALYMVDRGFDVWSLCCRGVQCSHKQLHTHMNWNDQNYWKYTLHEMAIFDIPPAIDYILNQTNQSKLFMVGHSAGNTIQYILLSELPEYNEKIKIAVALAPTVFLGLSEDPTLKLLSSLVNIGKGLYFKILGSFEGVPIFIAKMIMGMAKEACHDEIFAKVCIKFTSLIGSHHSVLVDYEKLLPFMIADASYRISAMEIFQYAAIVNSGKFARYDYGKKNKQIYGQMIPPSYNVTKITCFTAIFYAPHDAIASVKSVRKLKKQLPNLIMDYMVPFRRFTHTDFIFAYNASKLVYQPMAKMFKDYDNGKIYFVKKFRKYR